MVFEIQVWKTNLLSSENESRMNPPKTQGYHITLPIMYLSNWRMIKTFGEIVLSPLTMMQLQRIPKHQNRVMCSDTFSSNVTKLKIFSLGHPPLSQQFIWLIYSLCVLKIYLTYSCSILHITGDPPCCKSINNYYVADGSSSWSELSKF